MAPSTAERKLARKWPSLVQVAAAFARPFFHLLDIVIPALLSTLETLFFKALALVLPRYFFPDKSRKEADDLNPDQKYLNTCPGTYVWKGQLLPKKYGCPYCVRHFADFEMRDDDVIVVSYPKSGFTWTEEVVSQIYHGGDQSRIQDSLETRVVHVEMGLPVGLIHWQLLSNLRSPRLYGTHLRCDMLPKQFYEGKGKVIYVTRNGKDNAVSYYHHHRIARQMGFFEGTWDEFYHLYINGHLIWGSWFDHLKSYYEHRHLKNMLCVNYEEMKKDLRGNVLKLCEFLGRPLSEEAVQNVVHNCSFAQMKDNGLANRENMIAKSFEFERNEGKKFCRKGVVGDWQHYFTPRQSEEFDAIYRREIQSRGMNFQFLPNEDDGEQ